MPVHTECNSEIGITLGLIDGLIALCRVVAVKNKIKKKDKKAISGLLETILTRNLSSNEANEAMYDLLATPEVNTVFKQL